MTSGTQARPEWRGLVSAAFIGWSVGLSLGVAYLASGMGQAAIDHSRAERVAAATGGDLSGKAFTGVDPSVMALAKPQDPFTQGSPSAQPAAVAAGVASMVKARPSRAGELECLTKAVYFEARGESARGQQAVATVILNRVKNPRFPNTICDVVYQGASRRNGCQFSFACDGRAERVVERTAWSRARQVAARALSGAVLRDVGSATHFHTTAVSPDWGPRMLRTAQVGLHVFYRFNPKPPRTQPQAPVDAPVFVSAPAQPVELRLATAVLAPTVEEAAQPAAASVASSAPAAVAAPQKPQVDKPKPKTVSLQPPAPMAQADTPAVRSDAATAS